MGAKLIGSNEKKLLNFIRYSPIVFITIIAIIVNILVLLQNEINFQKNIEKERKHFIQTQKVLVQNEVQKVYDNILLERADIEQNLKKTIRQKVYEAYDIVSNLYHKYHHLGEKKVLQIIKDALRNVRFNDGRGYFFIDNINGIKILQPINPEFEGKSFLEFKDKHGYQFVKTIAQTIQDNTERFDEYYWPKPGSQKAYKKISFYKTFEPLQFVIGTGEYLDEFTKKVQHHLLINRIKKVTFGKNGYVFVVDYDGVYLSHYKDEYIGMNRFDLEDKNGFKITQEIIHTAKQNEGFISYVGTIMPQTGKAAKKTTFVKGLDDWQWAIAAGFYEDELNAKLLEKEKELQLLNREYTKRILMISIVLSVFLIIISIYISSILRKFFLNYNQRIRQELNENRKKDHLLNQQTKMAAMGEMLANIAHQWRQPLSVITSIASSMKVQKELGVNTCESEMKYLDDISKNAEYLSHTIDDFRDFFKSDKNIVQLNIKDVIDKTCQLLSSKLQDKHIQIILEVESTQIRTIENELIQILMNIINNAQDALIKNSTRLIMINAHSKEQQLVITVTDNAGGIDEQLLSRIFEPYFTTKHQSKGTGLGLYMVKEMITRHMHGNIEVENVSFTYAQHAYKGAKFTLTLPKNIDETLL